VNRPPWPYIYKCIQCSLIIIKPSFTVHLYCSLYIQEQKKEKWGRTGGRPGRTSQPTSVGLPALATCPGGPAPAPAPARARGSASSQRGDAAWPGGAASCAPARACSGQPVNSTAAANCGPPCGAHAHVDPAAWDPRYVSNFVLFIYCTYKLQCRQIIYPF
jgi:hypothetical protein